MRTVAVAIVALVVISSVCIATSLESDADSQYVEHWCYGDVVYLNYEAYGSDANVEWTIYDESMGFVESGSEKTHVFHASNHDTIYVEQTVELNGHTAIETVKINLMHVERESDEGGDGMFIVAFLDEQGGDVVGSAYFGSETVISAEIGQTPTFVSDMPETPVKDGVAFLGWYYEGSDGNEYAFDPSEPVVSDMVVYAKWSETGTGDSGNSGGSGGTIVIGDVHIVTFECVQGLTYSVVSTGSSSVSFTVNEVPGFSVDPSSIEVTANGSPLELVNGTYTVSGINSDVLVSIQGDVISLDNPDDGGIPFWVWIVLIIVIVLAIAVVYWMYIRNQRQ